jgi:hypothetical protein
MTVPSGDRPTPVPTAGPRTGVILLLLFACVPYGLMISALPGRDDFPGGGGGEATVGWGMLQFVACALCAILWLVLWLALYVATRKGGFSGSVRFVHGLMPLSGTAATVAVGLNFDTPGVWLALVPIVLPPVIAAYTLFTAPVARPGVTADRCDRNQPDGRPVDRGRSPGSPGRELVPRAPRSP